MAQLLPSRDNPKGKCLLLLISFLSAEIVGVSMKTNRECESICFILGTPLLSQTDTK